MSKRASGGVSLPLLGLCGYPFHTPWGENQLDSPRSLRGGKAGTTPSGSSAPVRRYSPQQRVDGSSRPGMDPQLRDMFRHMGTDNLEIRLLLMGTSIASPARHVFPDRATVSLPVSRGLGF